MEGSGYGPLYFEHGLLYGEGSCGSMWISKSFSRWSVLVVGDLEHAW